MHSFWKKDKEMLKPKYKFYPIPRVLAVGNDSRIPRVLLVRNLPFTLTAQQLEAMFSPYLFFSKHFSYGRLLEARILLHKDTGRSRGIAMVQYLNKPAGLQGKTKL
jgi:RNA recognition motif-containing protein